jgi:ABC-type uncharacterized transport system permease subunit
VTLVHLTANLGLLGFAVASVLYLWAFGKAGGRGAWGAKSAFGLFLFATLAVTVALGLMLPDATLLSMSGLLLTSAIGWLAVVGHVRFNLRLIGAIVAPLATLILLMQIFVAPVHTGAAPLAGTSPPDLLVTFHVAMAIVGQAFAIIACAVSVFLLWQQTLLKKKLLDQLPTNLPAIDRIDFLLRLSLWTGFIFLTLGLLSGAVYTQLFTPPAQLSLSAKVIWATAVWIWYLATLLAKNVFNRPSKRIAQMSLGGFLLLALSYFGIGFFRSGGG